MILTTLKCDACREFGLVLPDAAPAQLRREAKREGWRKARQPDDDGLPRYVDICPLCVAKEADQSPGRLRPAPW